MSIAVFDIDGVVADVRHRIGYLQRRPKDWSAFFAHAASDGPLAQGIELVQQLISTHHDIVWLTGRPDWLRSVTRDWLAGHELPTGSLIMRSNGDYRAARIMKVEALRELEARPDSDITLFVDDDPDVITAASHAGFTALLADWVPRDSSLHAAQEQAGRT
ncbi:MAG TPA: hypothetical protein VGH11_06520 [Jatrophihabitans sp.]